MDRAGYEDAGAGPAERGRKSDAPGKRLKPRNAASSSSMKVSGAIIKLQKFLLPKGIVLRMQGQQLTVTAGEKEITFFMTGLDFEMSGATGNLLLPVDLLVRCPEKAAAMIMSKLGANKRVFARDCDLQKVSRPVAELFLDQFHLMGSTGSAYSYGLYRGGELLAVASFSKGRKMNRLKASERSFELIRFCTRPGSTITGGLSRLVRSFCREKKAAEVMTYVDKQFSDGRSFASAGFKKHSDTDPHFFLVNRNTYERKIWDKEMFDERKHYLTHNRGNLKMIFTCP